jgi:hypothetical protein
MNAPTIRLYHRQKVLRKTLRRRRPIIAIWEIFAVQSAEHAYVVEARGKYIYLKDMRHLGNKTSLAEIQK